MSWKERVRNICRKVGIGRLLLIGFAGIVLVLCSLDFGSISAGSSESGAESGSETGAGQSTGSNPGTASGAAGTGSTAEGQTALTDIFLAETEEALSMQELEARLEARLAELLSQIQGVGEAEVMIVLSSGVGKEILKDESASKEEVTETDSAGGSRQSVSYDQAEDTVMDSAQGSSEQTPYVLKNLAPEIAGVAVVADGGGDAAVAARITELVSALFDIDVTRISVAPRG